MASFRVENSLVWGRKWPRFLAAFAEVFQLDLRTAIAASNNRGRFLPRQYPSRSKKVQEFLEEPRARTRCCFCLFLGFLLIGGLGRGFGGNVPLSLL